MLRVVACACKSKFDTCLFIIYINAFVPFFRNALCNSRGETLPSGAFLAASGASSAFEEERESAPAFVWCDGACSVVGDRDCIVVLGAGTAAKDASDVAAWAGARAAGDVLSDKISD